MTGLEKCSSAVGRTTPLIAFQPDGQATGIGSMPFTAPRAALALIGTHLQDIPYWPQLPRGGRQEHFVHQFFQPLVECGLLCVNQEPPYPDASAQALADRLTEFYHLAVTVESLLGGHCSIDPHVTRRKSACGLGG